MNVNRVAALVSSTAVIIAVGFGLLIVGSPQDQRLQRLDQARVGDLELLAHVIDAYWTDHAVLPDSLTDLVDGRRLSQLPTDPVTDASYEYAVTTGSEYRLCATFEQRSPEHTPEFWRHDLGHTCYDFDVTRRNATRPG
jgi:hypothetical protein